MATIWKAGISDSCHRFHGLTHQTEIKWSWDVFTSPRTGGSPMEAEHPSRIVGAGHTIYSHTSVLYPIKPHFPHCFLYVSYFPYLSHKNPWKLRVAGSPQARPTKLHLLKRRCCNPFRSFMAWGPFPNWIWGYKRASIFESQITCDHVEDMLEIYFQQFQPLWKILVSWDYYSQWMEK